MTRLAIIGAFGHGKVVADIALKLGYIVRPFFLMITQTLPSARVCPL